MKKVVSLLLVAFLAITLTGCGKKENKNSKYKNIYCEKNTDSIKETIDIKTGKPEDIYFNKIMSYETEEAYNAGCALYNDMVYTAIYNGVVNSFKCDSETKTVTETKKYIIADAKMSFDLSYIKKNGELDGDKFIEEFEIDGYKCEYK